MATFSNFHDDSYEDPHSRSPRAYRSQQYSARGTGSRNMDSGYGTLQSSGFNNGPAYGNNNIQSLRYPSAPFGLPMSNGMQGAPINNGQFPYDSSVAQTWNAATNGLAGFGGGAPNDLNRGMRASRGRGGLSNLWDDSVYSMPPGSQQTNRQVSMGMPPPSMLDDDDELIPTAIVIKNIPFAVKKEQLVELMSNMNLPLPYAFNYHFDNGVFRGLAFANFTSPVETDQVIQALNHLELSGRKLRVEYKKMLPLAERERIEREKRERRGQLEEQHRPLPSTQLHSQVSLGAISQQTRNTPSPSLHRAQTRQTAPDVDMNDATTLNFYTQLLMFKSGTEPETLIFPADLSPEHRKLVHTLAHHMSLQHTSHGDGERRQVHVQRPVPGANISPPNALPRRGLSRTNTSEYEGGRYDGPEYGTLRGQASVGLLGVSHNDAFGRSDPSNLRNAKSFHDLRSWSPSPAHSAASFPAELQRNGARLQAMNIDSVAGNVSSISTPGSNSAAATTADAGRDQPFLISSFNNLGLGNGSSSQTSPRRQRNNYFNSNTTWEDQPYSGAIGSKRTVSSGADNLPPVRQSRGPNGSSIGFRRGRGSDEMRTPSAIAE